MHKGIIAYVVVIIVVIVGAYFYTGFRFLPMLKKTTTVYTSTIAQPTNSTASTVTSTSTVNYSNIVQPCSDINISSTSFNSNYTKDCTSNGGKYGIWVAAGNSGTEYVTITGADGITYVNQSSTYDCITFYQNFTLPSQVYTVRYRTGSGGGTCGNSTIVINTTTTPPLTAYHYVYNGDFGNGEYTGWIVTNPGFGTAPLNTTYANSKLCYLGREWSNYNGTYFATTYNCGITTAPGNLTSLPFIVDPTRPFLNFKMISPQDNNLYIELLRANYKIVNGKQIYVNSTPVEVARFNTFNLSVTSYSSSTFANVTLPLTLYINQPVQIRLVAMEEGSNFMAAGDFVLSNRPHQDKGITENVTFPSG